MPMKADAMRDLRFKRLRERTGWSVREAVGFLWLLQTWTELYSEKGRIGAWENEDIAKAVCWEGDARECVALLLSCGYLTADTEWRLLHVDVAPKRSTKRRAQTPVPDALTDKELAQVLSWAEKRGLTPEAVEYGWRVFHSQASAKGYTYADHRAAFMNALGMTGDPWALRGYEGPGSLPVALSPAQKRADGTKGAARAVVAKAVREEQMRLGGGNDR